MISSRGLGSWSEYLSVTYSCSPDLESNFDPSHTNDVERNVSVHQYSALSHTDSRSAYCIAVYRGAEDQPRAHLSGRGGSRGTYRSSDSGE
jgi:hypothetical protein